MRISKLYLVLCAAAFCGGVIAARADDNPDQAAARAALEAKMRELNAQPATQNAPAPAEQTPSAAPTTSQTQKAPSAAPANQVHPAPVAVAPANASAQPANPPAGMATRTAEPPSTASGTSHGWFEPVPPPSGTTPMTTESQRTAGQKGEHPQPSTTVQAPPQQPVYAEPQENPNAPYPGQSLGFKPIPAPPLPITQSQEGQLQALLEKYEANAITPEQYQTARARILHER